ncbi:MAG: hypothetical protein R3D46_12300 [Defluviimonas denitrificans]
MPARSRRRTSGAPSLYHGIAAPFRARGFAEIARRRPERPLLRLRLEDRKTVR